MLGLIFKDDHISWTDEKHIVRYGRVVTLTDDEIWADVCELGQDDVTQLPTAHLNAIDELKTNGRTSR